MATKDPKTLDQLVALMLADDPSFQKAKYFRRAIDNNVDVRQKLTLQKHYIKAFEEFAAAAIAADQEGGPTARFQFEGQTFTARPALRTVAAVKNRSHEKYKRANFKQQSYMFKKLFPDLVKGQELGHKNLSVLRVSIGSTLKAMDGADPRRDKLKALYALVLQIDELTEQGEEKLEPLIQNLERSIKKGYSVRANYIKDVNIAKGLKGSIELEFEGRDINQYKGRLAGKVGSIFREVILSQGNEFEKLFGNIDIANIQGSPSLQQDITKQLVDTVDPKKKAKKSRSKTSTKKTGGGTSVTLGKTKKSKVKKPTAKRGKRSEASLFRYIGILNQQLPTVVAKNMGDPALNYRTGRFASSVRATDISRTPQGFPSIGYTYQLNPYQTFEPGYAQGDPDRDPRPLIDRSIREIMAQFAIGRFYTRRQ